EGVFSNEPRLLVKGGGACRRSGMSARRYPLADNIFEKLSSPLPAAMPGSFAAKLRPNAGLLDPPITHPCQQQSRRQNAGERNATKGDGLTHEFGRHPCVQHGERSEHQRAVQEIDPERDFAELLGPAAEKELHLRSIDDMAQDVESGERLDHEPY